MARPRSVDTNKPVHEHSEPSVDTNKPSDDLVTEGQKNDPAPPEAHNKEGPAADIAAPGEAKAGEKREQFRTTGPFLVHDPYTLDAVGQRGGEMRVTHFVESQVSQGKLERL